MRRAVIAAFALGACGGGGPAPEGDDGADAAVQPGPDDPDADPGPDPDVCNAPAPITGAPDLVEGTAVIDSASFDDPTLHRIDYDGRLAETTLLRFALIEGVGGFAAGLATGTYAIAGDDAAIETCGVCLLLVTDFFQPSRSQYFLARAGAITFDTLVEDDAGRIAGSAADLDLVRLVFKEEQWRPDPGCTTALDSVRFDVGLEPGPFYEE